MKAKKDYVATDEELFPLFAECGFTPDDFVPDMAERYRSYLEGSTDRVRLSTAAGDEDAADARVAAETDAGTGPSEVILEVGAEGGSLTLYGARTPDGWRYSRRVLDQTMALLDLDDGEVIDEESAVVGSWSAALALLDKYPWHRLYPLEVHPEFRGRVMQAVVARVREDLDKDPERVFRWKAACSGNFD
jgi:hypothetical protein